MSCEFCAFAASRRASVMVATGPSTAYRMVSDTPRRLAAGPIEPRLLNGERPVHLRMDAAVELVRTGRAGRGERGVLPGIHGDVELAVVGRDGVPGRPVVVHGNGRARTHRLGGE